MQLRCLSWFWISLTLVLGITEVRASTTQAIAKTWDICPAAVNAAERLNAIPLYLLRAISKAESGRWHEEKQVNIAWPWTVTSGDAGKFFDTKREAVAEVEFLMTKGVRNIDVGCMQINLQYHPNAFASLDQAFNPGTNVGYAKNFLLGLHKSTGSWIQAAANYHSANPQLNLNYRTKILRIWREVSGVPLEQLPLRPSNSQTFADPGTRVTQTVLLNSRFRARLDAERSAQKHVKARDQLQAWRQARTSPSLLGHTAALQRARMLQRQRSELENMKPSFAQKRRQQLNKWRKNPHTAFR